MRHPPSLAALLLMLGLIAATATAYAAVYRIVDETGRVTYTDKPPAGNKGEKVDLPAINTQPGIDAPAPAAANDDQATVARYRRIEILQPSDGSTIPSGQLDLLVQVGIEPDLQAGHLITVLLDGKPVARPAAATSLRLDNLERGMHRLEAKVVNQQGQWVAGSEPVTIYVQRASRLINPKSGARP
jgi:hypothetical protein